MARPQEEAVELIGAMGGSLLGAVVALVVARASTRHASRQWREEALVRGVGFLTGGRQERSAGIGLIEALVASGNIPADIRPAIDNIMWNQLIYVSFHGDLSARHERINARRLLRLIEDSPSRRMLPEYSDALFDDVRSRVEGEGQRA